MNPRLFSGPYSSSMVWYIDIPQRTSLYCVGAATWPPTHATSINARALATHHYSDPTAAASTASSHQMTLDNIPRAAIQWHRHVVAKHSINTCLPEVNYLQSFILTKKRSPPHFTSRYGTMTTTAARTTAVTTMDAATAAAVASV